MLFEIMKHKKKNICFANRSRLYDECIESFMITSSKDRLIAVGLRYPKSLD